ncbi:Camk2b protein [Pelomyxa schiedti]|nr:Camk2b protein [Pelomyxa schiedti]
MSTTSAVATVQLQLSPTDITAAPKFNPGNINDYYDFADVLGRGTYSVVKLAGERATGDHWAVKIINKSADKHLSSSEKFESLLNELKCWSTLCHPNVVLLKEVFDSPENYYIVQELVFGGTMKGFNPTSRLIPHLKGELFDQIVGRTRFSEHDAKTVMYQLVTALQHLHESGICHRDLKPENLLLSDKSETPKLKLVDFGLACRIYDVKKMSHPVGTPGYIAPEILELLDTPGTAYGAAVDVWSAGVIMYILLTGSTPFYHDDLSKSYDMTLSGKYSLDFPYLSPESKDLLSKILVLDPSSRYTITQIMNHPWMTEPNPDLNLERTLVELRKFNAARRWKMAINATKAVNRFRRVTPPSSPRGSSS